MRLLKEEHEREARLEQERQREELEMLEQQRQLEEQQRQYDLELQRYQLEQQRMQEQFQKEQEMIKQRTQQELFLQSQAQGNHQLEIMKQQQLNDRNTINQYEQRMNQLQMELQNMSLKLQSNPNQALEIKTLNTQVNEWKQKYEALAKLYAQLRKEHLELLQKFKVVKDQGGKIQDDARKSIEQIQQDLKNKSSELTEVLVERNRLKGDADRIRLQYEGDLSRLRTELDATKNSLTELSKSRGDEVQSLVQRFTSEQQRLEQLLSDKQYEIQSITHQLGDVITAFEQAKNEAEEERQVLQAGLDQALELLKQHQSVLFY